MIEQRFGNSYNSVDYEDYDIKNVRCGHILMHAATLLTKAKSNPEDPEIRTALKDDLSNYLYKINQGEGSGKTASLFIKALLSLGLYREVADCL